MENFKGGNRTPTFAIDYKTLQENAYSGYVEAVYRELTRETVYPFSITMGNNYRITTSRGEELLLKSILRSRGDRNQPFEHGFLLAFNTQGALVGHTAAWIDPGDEFETYIVMNGGIAIKDRGRGYAIPMTLAMQSLIQERVNMTEKRVVLVVTNDNAATLTKRKQEGSYSDEILRDLETEQSRWQNSFSSQGKLGINEYGVINITPKEKEAYERILGKKEIWLQRKDIEQDEKIVSRAIVVDFSLLPEDDHQTKNVLTLLRQTSKMSLTRI